MIAVNRGTRRVDVLVDRHPNQCFKEALSRPDVVLCIDAEITPPAFPHSSLSRQVEHVRDPRKHRLEIHIL
jgi:hypothetical protein